MISFLEFVQSKAVVLGDGAMGSMLIDAGLRLDDCAELWNLSRTDTIEKIHKLYLDAGSDFLVTNTFGANPFRLRQHDLHERAKELNRAAVLLAKSVCRGTLQHAPTRYVIGSIGPSGQVPEPLGSMPRGDLIRGFAMQAEALIEGEVDGIIIETMIHVEEALAALQAVKSVQSDIPVIVSICFQQKKGNFQTALGISPRVVAQELERAGADIVGANCMQGFEEYVELTKQINEGTSRPVMVQPNAGQPVKIDDQVSYPMTPERMQEHIPGMIQNGASIIGGCCGTTPEHIKQIRCSIDRL